MSLAASNSPDSDSAGMPDCFLPDQGPAAPREEESEMLAEGLPSEGSLPEVLSFVKEEPPKWEEEEVRQRVEETEGPEILTENDFFDDYVQGFADTKQRLVNLISGVELESREATQRGEQLQLSSETLHFHLERIDQIQAVGLPRTQMIREFERGLVALDAAEQDLDSEMARLNWNSAPSSRGDNSPFRHEWLGSNRKFALLQVFAFFLPLLIFALVALILIGTAFGWF